MSFLFGSLIALTLALVVAQSATSVGSNSTASVTPQPTTRFSCSGCPTPATATGFIIDATSWGDYNARPDVRLNAEGVDLLMNADEQPVRLTLKAGLQGTYYLVGWSGTRFWVSHRLSRNASSSAPDVVDYLKTLDLNSTAYVTASGMTQVTSPPFPLYYTSMRADNWTRPAVPTTSTSSSGTSSDSISESLSTVVVTSSTSVESSSSGGSSSSGSLSDPVSASLSTGVVMTAASVDNTNDSGNDSSSSNSSISSSSSGSKSDSHTDSTSSLTIALTTLTLALMVLIA